MKIQSFEEVIEKILREDPLRDFFTWWDEIHPDDVQLLREAIDTAQREEDIQQFLQSNPKFLIQHLGGGHGRWVIPKKRLGSEHVTDFMIAEKHSFGFEWQAVELESPLKPMFNKSGDPSQYLNHAIRQIQDWRAWLTRNQNYASQDRNKGGLGLTDIDSSVKGLILIDRRSSNLENFSELRRQMVKDLNIRIHTYDYLVESLEGRLNGLAVWGRESET